MSDNINIQENNYLKHLQIISYIHHLHTYLNTLHTYAYTHKCIHAYILYVCTHKYSNTQTQGNMQLVIKKSPSFYIAYTHTHTHCVCIYKHVHIFSGSDTTCTCTYCIYSHFQKKILPALITKHFTTFPKEPDRSSCFCFVF